MKTPFVRLLGCFLAGWLLAGSIEFYLTGALAVMVSVVVLVVAFLVLGMIADDH